MKPWAWLLAKWPLLAGITAVGAAIATTKAKAETVDRSPTNTSPPKHYTGFSNVRKLAQEVGKAAGLSSSGRKWLERFSVIQASSESGANNYRGLGLPPKFPAWAKPSSAKLVNGSWVSSSTTDKGRWYQANEAKAAQIAYDRNVTRGSLPPSSATQDDWTFGSGGYFGFLPANGAYTFRKSIIKDEFGPLDVFDARRSLLMLMRTLAALTGWSSFKLLPANDQVTGLKRAMASPTLIPKPNSERGILSANRARAAAKKLGVPSSFFDEPVPTELRKQSRDWVAIARKMEGRA